MADLEAQENNIMNNSGSSLSFAGLLTLIFITLKLTEVISWSWWWVLSPIWISFSILLIVIAVASYWTFKR